MSLHYLGKYEPRKWSFQYCDLKTMILQLAISLILIDQINKFL